MIKFLRSNFLINQICIRRFILGLETSCDDTGTAIIDLNGNLLSEHLESQIKVTSCIGGIIPTVARQLHLANVEPCVKKVMDDIKISFSDLSAIALTVTPGIAFSLKVGRDYAVEQANKFNIPIIPIHHMEAHALMVRMFDKSVDFPFMVLLISGGNSILGVAHSVDRFSLFGTKLDISPGDCLDKIARTLHLVGNAGTHTSVSGGRAVELLALENTKKLIEFNNCRSKRRDCDFSFTGLESFVANYVERLRLSGTQIDTAQICASVLYNLGHMICRRLQRCMMYCRHLDAVPTTLVVSGGVASNLFLRKCFQHVCNEFDYRLICPPVKYCTDNGVMIAWNGYELFKLGKRIVTDANTIDFTCRTPLGSDLRQHILDSDIRLPPLKLKSIFTEQ